ncbi:MAG: phage tail assembly chaperone [Methanoregula sp.]|jgi:hypothetical protein|nr:phage tail assembly chaperone [Methanoregula sp.]
MFEKHVTSTSTESKYEEEESGIYYQIYEVENARYIDPSKYKPYLDNVSTITDINKDPVPITDIQKWVTIRERRTSRLRGSDWTQLYDVDLTTEEKNLWKTYRKALRDIPQTYTDPDNVVWPIAPSI